MEEIIKRLEQENEKLKEKYSHVLELAKTNADSNEYCLQELEKKYEQLRSALEEIREIVSGNYETLDPQAKQEIQNIITEAIGE